MDRKLRTSGNVEAELEAVDGLDLALTSLVATADNGNLILHKLSTQRDSWALWNDLHPCGRECCAHRTSRGAPYSVAPEGC